MLVLVLVLVLERVCIRSVLRLYAHMQARTHTTLVHAESFSGALAVGVRLHLLQGLVPHELWDVVAHSFLKQCSRLQPGVALLRKRGLGYR